jgi:glycosyltransferase involved in cell wall biosynthesis
MKPKIAFVCIYSRGICGVWTSIYQLSLELIKKGYEIHVFSTNKTKGSDEIAESSEIQDGLHIHRFSPKLSIGRNINFWNFSEKLKEVNPDIIIAEVYRHPHTISALKLARNLEKPIFLVTHAPFVDKKNRSPFERAIEFFYDRFLGKKHINSFNEVINIAKWELPFLKKIGLEKSPAYIPNGIPKEFFKSKINFSTPKKILYFGRISPIKNLEILIRAMSLLKNKLIRLDIVGPAEPEYQEYLNALIKSLDLKNINFYPAVVELNKKIKIMDRYDIFILPSKREAMPQTLIEFMALGKIVIASGTKGAEEIVVDNENGFLFEIDNYSQLAEKINYCLDKKNYNKLKKIQLNARESVEKFNLENLADKLEALIKKYAK